MKSKFKHVLLYLALSLLPLSFVTCNDSISLKLINNSSVPVNINSPELSIDLTIDPLNYKVISKTDLSPCFSVKITRKSSVKKYYFRDMDHWFPLEHEVDITIDDNDIIIKGSRSERFYPEE